MKTKIAIKQISKFELFTIILVFILIACSAIGMLSYYNSSEILRKSIVHSMILRTEDNAELISQHINGFKTIIEGVAIETNIQTMDWELQRPLLISEAKRLDVRRFTVIDLKGFAKSTNGKKANISDREWIKTALKGVTNISKPFRSRIDNKMILVCATPIKNKEGNIVGALTASIEPEFLFNIIKDIKVGVTGYGFIIGKGGTMIAHPNGKFILPEIKGNEEIEAYKNFESASKEIANVEKKLTLYKLKGVEKCAIYTPIPNTNWNLALSAPKKEVFKEVDSLKCKFLSLALITIVICMLSCILIIGYILKKRKIVNLEKRVEEDNRLLRESAELEKLRTQFFANISHEFRTPLNVILSSLQLFKLYCEKEKALQSANSNKHLRTMKQNCYRLLRLINNLIDTTRMDVGFLEKHMKNHNIVKIVEDITMSIVEFTEIKGIRLLFDTNVEEKIIACDVDKIERIILNLISNAIKFTNPGGAIYVNVFDKGESICVIVKDTGIGIPKDKQEIIFERFVQVQQTLARNHEGSGIGLSMAKSFVEMHGGTLTVHSECGKGSEFIIELPATILKSEEVIECLGEAESQQRIERIHIEFSDIYYS